MQQPLHPVQFAADYPDRPLNRLTTFFRLFTVIPIAVVLGSVAGQTWQFTSARNSAIFVEGVIRWHNRVVAYALLLVTDRYPPFRLAP